MSDSYSTDPDVLEKELEETRQNLSETLHELHDRLSPGDIVEETFDYIRRQNFFRKELLDMFKENALPLSVIGAGTAWLVAQKVSGTSAKGEESSGVSSAAHDPHAKGAGIPTHTPPGQNHTRDSQANTAPRQKEDKDMQKSLNQAKSKMGHSARFAQDQSRQMMQKADQFIQERPLTVVAMGLGIGALLGMTLPETRREHQVMGQTRDRLKETVAAEGQAQVRQLRETAESLAEATKEQLREREQQRTESGNSSTHTGTASGNDSATESRSASGTSGNTSSTETRSASGNGTSQRS